MSLSSPLYHLVNSDVIYRKVVSKSMCYYSGIQVFGGATNQDVTKRDVFLFINTKPYWTALLYSLIEQPYCTALLNSLIVQPY